MKLSFQLFVLVLFSFSVLSQEKDAESSVLTSLGKQKFHVFVTDHVVHEIVHNPNRWDRLAHGFRRLLLSL